MKYLVLIIAILSLPIVSATYLQDAAQEADNFVINHGKFFHKYSFIDNVRLFRKLYTEDCNSISFLYMVTAKRFNKDIKSQFIVTLNRNDFSVIGIGKLKEKDKPISIL